MVIDFEGRGIFLRYYNKFNEKNTEYSMWFFYICFLQNSFKT